MSYTNKTTHYEIPLPTSTDLVNGLDWNDSSEAIDTALYNASQAATQVAGDITTIKATIALLEAADVTFQSDLNAVTGRVTTLEQNQGTIAEDVQDVADMITAYEEPTATASRAYEEGDPFRYNGVLYIATTDIAQGATIVPNVNCRATNVMEEMLSGGGEVVDATARAGVANNSAKIGTLANLDTTVKTDLVSAINEVLSQIGGGGMKTKLITNLTGSGSVTFSDHFTDVTFTSGEDYFIIPMGEAVQSGGSVSASHTPLITAKTATGFTYTVYSNTPVAFQIVYTV